MEERETGIGWGIHGTLWIYAAIDGRMGPVGLEEGKKGKLFFYLISYLFCELVSIAHHESQGYAGWRNILFSTLNCIV